MTRGTERDANELGYPVEQKSRHFVSPISDTEKSQPKSGVKARSQMEASLDRAEDTR